MRHILVCTLLLAFGHHSHASVGTSNLLAGYTQIEQCLSHDKYPCVQDSAVKFQTVLAEWLNAQGTNPAVDTVKKMEEGAKALAQTGEEAPQRTAFADLSEGFVDFLRTDKTALSSYQLYFCPMAPGYGYWAQPIAESIANPYFGLQMLTCGSKKPW